MLCPRCGKLNPADLESCKFCKARLFVRGGGPAQEAMELQPFQGVEDYMLDKLSVVERQAVRSSQDVDILVQAMDYIERNVMASRAGIGVLAGMLRERGLLDGAEFKRRWRERTRRDLVEINRKERFLAMKADILEAFKGKNRRRFEERLTRAEDYFLGLQSPKAVEALEEALALDPSNAPLCAILGQLYLAAGEKERARSCLDEALKAKGVPKGARLSEAILLLSQSDAEEAMKHLDKAAQADPADQEALVLLAFAHGARGRWARALELAAKALGMQEGAAPRYLKVQALLRLERAAEAEAELDEFITEYPECEVALLQKAHLLLSRGWWNRAKEVMERLAALNPDARYELAADKFAKAGSAKRREMRILPLDLATLLDLMNPEGDEARLYLREIEGEL
jgi:tetratricopeptide (TPR) repeat protein